MDEYMARIDELMVQVSDGIGTYACELVDLDGYVLGPIGEMEELTRNTMFPPEVDVNYLFDCLREAEDGAVRYAETLYDTTDCTYPLDQMHDYLVSCLG